MLESPIEIKFKGHCINSIGTTFQFYNYNSFESTDSSSASASSCQHHSHWTQIVSL